ncbi:MAG: DUF3499 family protein [Ilumatobacteraceae bacterium]
MARLCERPGCSEPGAVAYGMNAVDLVFWVEPLGRHVDHDDRVLCRRHADAMVVPRGWTLDDRREPVPRLFRPPTPRSTGHEHAPTPRRRRAPSVPSVPAEQLPLVAAADEGEDLGERAGAGAGAGAGDGDGDGDGDGAGWAPTFDTDDDLDGLLSVDSPLLARAFRGRDRPRRRG